MEPEHKKSLYEFLHTYPFVQSAEFFEKTFNREYKKNRDTKNYYTDMKDHSYMLLISSYPRKDITGLNALLDILDVEIHENLPTPLTEQGFFYPETNYFSRRSTPLPLLDIGHLRYVRSFEGDGFHCGEILYVVPFFSQQSLADFKKYSSFSVLSSSFR